MVARGSQNPSTPKASSLPRAEHTSWSTFERANLHLRSNFSKDPKPQDTVERSDRLTRVMLTKAPTDIVLVRGCPRAFVRKHLALPEVQAATPQSAIAECDATSPTRA